MNIGIVTTWFDRGAAYVSKAYMDVLMRDHSVFIYARGGEFGTKGDPSWDLPNVSWGTSSPYKPYMYIDWMEFIAWINTNHIDVLLFNEQHDWDVILRAQQLEIPVGAYVDYYTTETYQFYWMYDFLLCNTRRHYSLFDGHPQAFYIPWGTNVDVFKPLEHQKSTEKITFFHSCGANPIRKGTELLVKAFSQVSGQAELVIHSQWPLEERFPNIVKLIREDSRITLVERVVPPPGLYSMGDVYVYPTVLEGIGLTIAEALASGLPVITTNEPPMNEFVVDGENGKLVDVAYYKARDDNYYWRQSFCDQSALQKALSYYIDHVDNLPEFKEKARLYALKKLDWNANSAFLPQLLSDIKIIHKSLDKKLVQKVQQFEQKRISNSTTFVGRVKLIVKHSIFYRLVSQFSNMFEKR